MFRSDGKILFVNAPHEAWFGLPRSKIAGVSLETALKHVGDDSSSHYFACALRGERVSFEMRVKHQQFGFRQMKVECIPFTNLNGTNEGFFSLATDITDVTHLVDALKLSQSKYRVASKENERLYQKSQLLNRAKDDFLAILSHELRTPLTVILGHAELLKELPNPPDEIAESIDSIHRNANAQNQIVSDLIDISSIITGKLSVQINSVLIGEITKGAFESGWFLAQRKSIELISSFQDENLVMTGDRNRLQQILMNLLTNAIKFTPEGGQIWFNGKFYDGKYEIRVRDTGRGIDKAFLPHVFDRFQQEDGSMTRSYGGLGLGLSIVQNLVEVHHGTIEAKSEGRGRGAEFIVRLPIEDQPELIEQSKQMAYQKSLSNTPLLTLSPTQLEKKRILIVDDEPDALRLVARYLERVGAEVKSAGSAKEALDTFQRFAPELIISDISMPEEDGYFLIRQIRSTETMRNLSCTPAIALTAFAREEDRRATLNAGFQAHLAKPFDSTTLTTLAHQTLLCPLNAKHPGAPDVVQADRS